MQLCLNIQIFIHDLFHSHQPSIMQGFLKDFFLEQLLVPKIFSSNIQLKHSRGKGSGNPTLTFRALDTWARVGWSAMEGLSLNLFVDSKRHR